MNRRAIAGAILGAAMVAGFVCVWRLQQKIDSERNSAQLEKEELTLRSPGVMKKLSLEYAPLMGAIYWTRVVQYYGEKHRLHDQNLELLWPLLDITTTLDAHLIVAYRFGAIFLSDSPPRGAGEPDQAVVLLERGMKANTGYWRLYQDLGNVYYFDKRDYAKASQAFEAGSKFPAKIAAEGESLETSYALWLDIYQTASEKDIRKNAEDHLKLVKAEMDLRQLEKLADEFEKKLRRRPTRLNELVESGFLPGLSKDPDGYPYLLGETGKAEIHPQSPLHEDWLKEKLFVHQSN
jgi:hypothetical protein